MTIKPQDENDAHERPAFGGVSSFKEDVDDIEIPRQFHREKIHIIRRNIRRIAKKHKIKVSIEAATIGFYFGKMEASYVLDFQGDELNVSGFLGEWGKCHDQMSVVGVFSDKFGEGFRYILPLKQSISKDDEFVFLPKLESELLSQQLSGTLRDDEHGRIKYIEYWGQTSDDNKKTR